MRSWRNRQTRYFEVVVGHPVGVQVPPTAPKQSVDKTAVMRFYRCGISFVLHPGTPHRVKIRGIYYKMRSWRNWQTR